MMMDYCTAPDCDEATPHIHTPMWFVSTLQPPSPERDYRTRLIEQVGSALLAMQNYLIHKENAQDVEDQVRAASSALERLAVILLKGLEEE